MEVAKYTDRDWTFWDVLPAATRKRFQTLRPAKGYHLETKLKLFVNETRVLCKRVLVSYTNIQEWSPAKLHEVVAFSSLLM